MEDSEYVGLKREGTGLSSLALRDFPHSDQYDWWINCCGSRRSLRKIHDSKAIYTIIQTYANPKAAEELKNYVATREEWEPWNIRKVSECAPKSYDSDDILGFGTRLMDTYLNALEKICLGMAKFRSHAAYPAVECNMNSGDRPWASIYWPVNHIVKDEENVEKFKAVAGNLNDDKNYEVVKEFEHPHNRQMARVDTLRNLKIEPLIISPEVWHVDGLTLKNAVNFLVPFMLSEESLPIGFDSD